MTNHVHLIAKLGMLEAVFIPSKIGGVMLITGEITLPFTEIFERQNEVHYTYSSGLVQMTLFIVLYISQKMCKL